MPTQQELTGWEAASREELKEIWQGLVGDLDEATSHTPTFRGDALTAIEAGYLFQTWVLEALRLSHSEVDGPFQIPVQPGIDDSPKHEIDGLLSVGWQGFLIESKFQKVDFAPLARLHILADGGPAGTMGLFFATGGYTSPALEAAHILRPMRLLLFDGRDLKWIVKHEDLDLASAVRAKWKAAIKLGRVHFPIQQIREREPNT